MLVIEFINDTVAGATASTEEIIYANHSATPKVWNEKAWGILYTHMFPTDKILEVILPSAQIWSIQKYFQMHWPLWWEAIRWNSLTASE